jgi:murein DD-endopeptidase MepM/ murein hydrolase activator NlpD
VGEPVPSAPVNLQGTVSGQTLTMTFSPASTGSVPDGYVLEAGTTPGAFNIARVPIQASPFVVNNVPAGTYYVRIRATNRSGTSAASNEITITVLAPGTLGPPTALTATVGAVRRVTISWIAPASGTPTGYRLEAGSTAGLSDIALVTLGNQTTFTADFVPVGTYYVRVRGVNSAGVGAPSQEVLLTVTDVAVPCGDGPNVRNRVLPIFSAPFRGTFRMINHFDHDLPLQFEHTNGYVVNSCGDRPLNSFDGHAGHDFWTPNGTPLYAVGDGQVVQAGNTAPFLCPVLGNRTVTDTIVEIRHPAVSGEIFQSSYLHMSRVDVAVGQTVTRGQQIGLSGESGCAVGAHLHFQVFRLTNTNNRNFARVDPYGWEGPGVDPWSVHPQGASSFWLWLPGQAPPLR